MEVLRGDGLDAAPLDAAPLDAPLDAAPARRGGKGGALLSSSCNIGVNTRGIGHILIYWPR